MLTNEGRGKVNNSFDGKCAVVTGGSRGIGAELTRQLRAAGCRVAVLARGDTHGVGDLNIACDVADEEAQKAAFTTIADKFAGLDFAFINAGVNTFVSLLDMSMAEWDRVIDVNLRGAVISLRETARLMRDSGSGGSIVTCCSLSSFKPEKFIAPYNVSKAGLANLTATAAREFGEYNIRVNGIAPGLTLTDLIAGTEAIPGYIAAVEKRTTLGQRLGTSADIADSVMKLLTMSWVTGQIITADGGLSLHTPTDPCEFFR